MLNAPIRFGRYNTWFNQFLLDVITRELDMIYG